MYVEMLRPANPTWIWLFENDFRHYSTKEVAAVDAFYRNCETFLCFVLGLVVV
jgi:hypothetical protein